MNKSTLLTIQRRIGLVAIGATSVLAVAISSSVLGDTDPPKTATSPSQAQQGSTEASMTNDAGLVDISKLNGAQINNNQGTQLGTISQLLVDPQTGLLRFAVIHVDQQNDVAVPWPALNVTMSPSGPKLALDATKEKLDKAPKLKVGEAERLFTKEASKPIYDYWTVIWFEAPNAVGEKNQQKQQPQEK